MLDVDLIELHGQLRRMGPTERILVGDYFQCLAGELSWVIEEAMSAREQAKAAGTFQPYQNPFSDF